MKIHSGLNSTFLDTQRDNSLSVLIDRVYNPLKSSRNGDLYIIR